METKSDEETVKVIGFVDVSTNQLLLADPRNLQDYYPDEFDWNSFDPESFSYNTVSHMALNGDNQIHYDCGCDGKAVVLEVPVPSSKKMESFPVVAVSKNGKLTHIIIDFEPEYEDEKE